VLATSAIKRYLRAAARLLCREVLFQSRLREAPDAPEEIKLVIGEAQAHAVLPDYGRLTEEEIPEGCPLFASAAAA